MGDEVRRTQRGNNNAYCHDDDANWFDWNLLKKHADVHRFVKLLIQRRLLRNVDIEQNRISLSRLMREGKWAWHGVRVNQPDWSDSSHTLAFSVEVRRDRMSFYMIVNAYHEALNFELPPPPIGQWRRWIDTALDSPNDIVPWQQAAATDLQAYPAEARSVVVLYSQS
jgi:glycogen operon protein